MSKYCKFVLTEWSGTGVGIPQKLVIQKSKKFSKLTKIIFSKNFVL